MPLFAMIACSVDPNLKVSLSFEKYKGFTPNLSRARKSFLFFMSHIAKAKSPSNIFRHPSPHSIKDFRITSVSPVVLNS